MIGTINKTKTTAIFINQLRQKVGVMFGNPETTPGGKALKYYSSVRLDIRRGEQIKQGNDVIGNNTKIKVVDLKISLFNSFGVSIDIAKPKAIAPLIDPAQDIIPF